MSHRLWGKSGSTSTYPEHWGRTSRINTSLCLFTSLVYLHVGMVHSVGIEDKGGNRTKDTNHSSV